MGCQQDAWMRPEWMERRQRLRSAWERYSTIQRKNKTADTAAAIRATATVAEPIAGFQMNDRFNQVVFGINTRNLGERMAVLEPGETVLVRFDVTLSLAPGEYALSLVVSDQSGHSDPNAATVLDGHERLGPLGVRCRTALMPFYGIAGIPTSCEIVQVTSS